MFGCLRAVILARVLLPACLVPLGNDTRIGQGLGHEAFRLARYQITALIHLTSMVRPSGHDGQMAAQHADVWPHILWTPGRKVHGHLAAR